MDKNTLSNYGWIVIAVLVLSVMIALSTPFGEYIKAGVESTTQGLFETQQSALEAAGIVDNTEYIELSSAEDLYALGTIFLHPNTKANVIGSSAYNQKLKECFGRFEYPEGVTSENGKRDYLKQAAYKLTSDVELRIQTTNDVNFFTGIGSSYYGFWGTFNGNGKTITLKGDTFGMNENLTKEVGLFGYARNATIKNLNVKINEDLIVTSTNGTAKIGVLVGSAEGCEISNCNIEIINSKIGAEYDADSTNCAYVGGLVGKANTSTIQNCTVKMNDSTLCAKGPNVDSTTSLGMFSVGGIVGFSDSGSDNTNNLGRIGNQVLNCKFTSKNTSQRDVICAYVETGDELTAGGIVGCSFNNMVVKNCSVEIEKGNIVAKKLNESNSTSGQGTQAGGIAGRMEHTGEIYNCSVNGNYLNIESQSNATTSAGGIVGYDWGAFHRNIITINKCSFDGNNTSTINAKNGDAAVGGIAGKSSYIIADNIAKNVKIVNRTENSTKTVCAGKIVGRFGDNNSTIASYKYFTPDTPEIRNCTSQNITFDTTDIVSVGEIYGISK